jgi:hypothetical protein
MLKNLTFLCMRSVSCIIFCIFCVYSCLSCALFADEGLFSCDKILMTNQGIFIKLENNLVEANTVTYVSDGMYNVAYGHCGRCGWVLDEKGKCTNQNCNQYGPRERD